MPCNGLLPALECGWADAAVGLEPILFVHPPITQPVRALGLSGPDPQATELETYSWAHGPLSTFHHFSPWQLWAFLMGVYRSF